MMSELESQILQTGMRLYHLIEGESPSVFHKEYWTGKMLEWCMQNEAFKIEMFRFIDVLPYLTRPEAIAGHLQEYFSDPDIKLPSALQWGLKSVSPTSLTAKTVAKTVAKNVAEMAGQFIIGAAPRDSLTGLERLRTRGMAFTVDLLGEAVVSEKEAEEYVARYLDLFDVLHEAQAHWPAIGGHSTDLDWGHAPRINVSVKVSAMYSQMNVCAFERSLAKVKERLLPIYRKAVQTGAFVTLDMESHALKDFTLTLYRSVMEEPEFRDYPHTGIVIQSYLRESEKDLREVIDWARRGGRRFSIRLVKGAYWDSEVILARQRNWPIPVFTDKRRTDAEFEKLARIIMENHEWVRLACASHNMRSIAYVVEMAKAMRLPPDCLEYQILYGMGEPVRNALRKAQLPVRLYTPIGDLIQGMSYLVRRLLENTANESFLRQSFSQGLPKEQLLRNPIDLLSESPTPKSAVKVAPAGADPFRNEPVFDWSVAEHRRKFREALEKTRRSMPLEAPLVIGGKRVRTRCAISSVNPNRTDEVVGVAASAEKPQVEEAVRVAKAAFDGWRDTAPETRADCLFKAAETARKMRYDLAALQVFEVGKSWSEADADVCEAIDFFEYYGREMLRLAVPQRMGRVPGERSLLFYEPRGVAAVIAPWNFPLAISAGMTSAALVTGNTVVYKPASQSPITGSMLNAIYGEAGLPPGVINFVPGPGGEIGDLLVTHPDVALIAFTGSMAVGLRIVESAAKTPEGASGVKETIVEMGGKNAIIVDSDADLDEAVTQILQSAFGYQGQKCSACSRLIVLEDIYRKLMDRLTAAAESIHIGPPEEPENVLGAVIEPAAKKKILEYIELGKKDGTTALIRESSRSEGNDALLAIFEDIPADHRLAREEIFGPVLTVFRAKDFGRALEMARNTRYALTGAVFSRSPGNIARACREFRTGNLYINRGCTGALVGRHPFGGFKMSGVGSKAGGPDYLLQFMVPRNVVENTMRRGFAPLKD